MITWESTDAIKTETNDCKTDKDIKLLMYRNVVPLSFQNRKVCFFLFFAGSRVPFVQREITNYCKDILLILERASSLSERVTANKLVDAWCGKGKSNLRVRDVKTPDMSREDCERVIVDMLLEGVLREDFHFTPYSTISYLLPGPKAGLIHSGKRLYMDFRDDSDSKSVSEAVADRCLLSSRH